MTFRCLHTADIHVSEKNLKWTNIALTALVKYAQAHPIDAWVIAGDSFDSAINVHSPAYTMFVRHVVELAKIAPGAILYGTPSHDRPGVLDPFKVIPSTFPIHIADRPAQMLLQAGEWYDNGGELTQNTLKDGDAVFSFLPSLNKADPLVMEIGATQYATDILRSFSPANKRACDAGIATILVSHGTVTGSVTESGYAMVSPDHSFTPQSLFDAGANATMLGHIHKTKQFWSNDTQAICYCGSLARLVHGDLEDKGFLVWTITAGECDFELIKSPTRTLLEISFTGIPDMEELEALAAKVDENTSVRIRWSVDTEFAHLINKPAIRVLFAQAENCKLEGTINAIQSVRAAGISKAITLEEKLEYYLKTTGDEGLHDDLVRRIDMLRNDELPAVIENIIGGNGK